MENLLPVIQESRNIMTSAIQTVVADPPGGFEVHHGWSVWLGGWVIMGGCVMAQGPRTDASLPPLGASSPLSTPPLGGTNCTWLRSISPGVSFSSSLAMYLSTVCSEKFVVMLLTKEQSFDMVVWYICMSTQKTMCGCSRNLYWMLESWLTTGDKFYKKIQVWLHTFFIYLRMSLKLHNLYIIAGNQTV